MADSANAGELSALSNRLDALEREARDLRAAFSAGRGIRTLMLLLVIAFVGGFTYLFYKMGIDFQSKQNLDKIMTEVSAKSPDISQDLTREMQKIMTNAGPKVRDAFWNQLQKDADSYLAAIEKERTPLVDNVQRDLNSTLNGHYDRILGEHSQVLKDEFKSEIKDDKDFVLMMDNFKLALHHMVKDFYVDRMKGQFMQLYKTWDEFPPAEAPKPDEPTEGSQIVGHLFEFFKEAIVKNDKPVGNTK